jgi:hypothetical protein
MKMLSGTTLVTGNIMVSLMIPLLLVYLFYGNMCWCVMAPVRLSKHAGTSRLV